MRFILLLGLSLLATERGASAAPDESPLAVLEGRVGQGVALGGGGGVSSWGLSPLSLSVLGSYAIREEPWVSVYGGLVFEGRGRMGAGATVGLRVNPGRRVVRLYGGGTVMALPFTAYGATVGAGRCFSVVASSGICADLEGTVFALGSDLPDDRIASQIQLVLGVQFDVL